MAWFKTYRNPNIGRPLRGRVQLGVELLEYRRQLSTLVGLTITNELQTFDSAAPQTIIASSRVSGLQRGEDLVGIDVRPATGEVYGLGDTGRLYTLDPFTGVATFKSRLVADPSDTTEPFTKLKGNSFGFDFNPVVDRLRVTSDADVNLRINVDTGLTITDTTLAYASGDINARRNPNVVSSAYENPDNDPGTGTMLRGIDSRLDVLVSQNPANSGTLITVGSLGFNASDRIGFDIDRDGVAYASLTPDSGHHRASSLYTINLATGTATRVGEIGGRANVEGLAILLPSQPVFAVTTGNNLISFNSARPDILTGKTAITGLQAGEFVQGIDFRPATGVLYALGSSGRLYTLNTATAVATLAPALKADPADTADANSPFSAVMGTAIGFDFNPVVDRLRVATDADQNLRINVGTGFTFTDGAIAYGAGDANAGQDPNVVASAYGNNFPGATATTLRGIDSRLDILVIQNPANAGTLMTVGTLGVNTSEHTSFDLSSGGVAYAGLTLVGGTNTGFYTINLTTGSATFVATIGGTTTLGGESVRGIAVAPPVVQFARATTIVREDRSPAVVRVVRTGDTSGMGTVNYAASAGTATAGIDFAAVLGSFTFNAGERGKTFLIPINDDNDGRGRGKNDAFWAGYGDWDWTQEWWSRIRRGAR